jgi:uncharacterized membrane protein
VAPTTGTKKSSGGTKKSASAAKTKKRSATSANSKASSNGSRGKAAAKSATKKSAPKKSAPKKAAPKKSAKAAATGAAAKSVLTTRPGGNVRLKMAAAAVKAAAKKAGERAKDALPVLSDGPRAALDKVRDASWDRMAERVRTVPVQQSVDVGVPLEAAWDEWMRFDWMPDGAHRVTEIERDDDVLIGQIGGPRFSRDWEAEITDERVDQSFAWQTTQGSDTSGLVTFHSLADRLTRIELQLDIVPDGPGGALALLLRRSDRRAQNVLRNFKAQVEALDPDEYPDVAEVEDDEEEEAEEVD